MVIGIFHDGSGLGNQLHRYVMTRVLAADKGYDFGMVGAFKGGEFMELDMGKPVPFPYHVERPAGKIVVESPWPLFHEGTTDYNLEGVRTVEDNTIIDGEFQGEEYYKHRKEEIRSWLKVDPRPFNMHFTPIEDVCVLNFRGGEYVGVHDLFLPRKYWYDAMENMKKINPRMRFGVVTDDVKMAQAFFPNFDIRHEIHSDWSAINNAHYLILSNSSFAILPAWLNQNVKMVIAPWGWSRHNRGYWFMEQNKMKGWHYQKLDGSLEVHN